MTPLEAFIIDNKLDDGLPNDGKIKVFNKDVNNDCYYNNYYKEESRMKRLIALILALLMCAFAFVSCVNVDKDQNSIATSENPRATEKAESTDELYNGHGSAKLIPAQRESDGAQFYVSEYGSEELRKVWTSREWSDTPENVSFDFVLNQPEKAIYYSIESGIFVSGGKALKLTDSEKTTLTRYFRGRKSKLGWCHGKYRKMFFGFDGL